MRDDPPRRGRGRAATGILIALAVFATPARGQVYHGYTQLQFQRLDPAGTAEDRDVWLRTLQLDLTKRLADRYDVSAQFLFNEVSYAGRPEGIRSPRGSLRVSHALFGGMLSYRPVRTTDPLGITTHQDELQVSGYFARPRWPNLNGSWIRRTRSVGAVEAPSTAYARNVSASQELGPLSLHAGYSDQVRVGDGIRIPTDERRNAIGGAQVRLGPPRASFLAQYDLTETKRLVSGDLTERTLNHSAGINGTSRFSKTVDVAYGFRRSLTRNGIATNLDDHEGSAVCNVTPRRSLRFASGGGVRTVRTIEQRDLQWYLLLLASLDGRVRPGWTARAGAARSWNWLSHDRGRPIDTYQAGTQMRFAKGLDLQANGQVSVTDPSGRAQADTLGRSARIVSQGGFTLTATPVRGLTGAYSRRGYRAGAGLTGSASSSRTDAWDVRWNPVARVDLTGSLQRTRGLGSGEPTLRTWRGTGQWTPSRRLELSASYLRSDNARGDSNGELPAGRETLSARALLGLTSDLRGTLLWTLVDPGKPTRGTRLEAGVTLGLGGRS